MYCVSFKHFYDIFLPWTTQGNNVAIKIHNEGTQSKKPTMPLCNVQKLAQQQGKILKTVSQVLENISLKSKYIQP